MEYLINKLYSKFYQIGLIGEENCKIGRYVITSCKNFDLLNDIAKKVQGRSKKFRVEIWRTTKQYAPELKNYCFMFIKN